MASDELSRNGLAALSVAAAELLEDHHDELVTTMPDDTQGAARPNAAPAKARE